MDAMARASTTTDPRRVGPWRLAAGLVAVTYALLVFGSTVRVHGAGLACPDWPLCFGVMVPELDFGVFLEWGHRVLASGVSFGFLAVAALSWRDGAAWSRVRGLLGVGAVLLAAQVVLGGLTVLHLLAEWTVTSHLVVGNTFCAVLLLVARRLVGPGGAPAEGWARAAVVALLVGVGAQMVLGGLVASSGAGLACGPTFPLCGGSSIAPTFSGLVGLQVVHRLVGVSLWLGALALAFVTRSSGPLARATGAVASVVTVQAALGITNVLTLLPVEITLAHSAGAAATVLCSVWAADVAFSGARAAASGAARPALVGAGARG